MTDGILLAEIQRDRMLRRYDTLIIDEAHERSLNIDFILGYLKQLLPQRPDLKVIVTSATIDTERFARHFATDQVIEVTGRTFPVEVRYRPMDDARSGAGDRRRRGGADRRGAGRRARVPVGRARDPRHGRCAPRLELRRPRCCRCTPGCRRPSSTGSSSARRTRSKRRVVLATNVAETSLTVPGVRYVVDTGVARISRYSKRLKVQRLPIEAVSQASANQRAGRCGRVAPGICIRLYDEDDFAERPEFTEPEILRTNLASVILQMTNIGLGDVAAFPFLEPPDRGLDPRRLPPARGAGGDRPGRAQRSAAPHQTRPPARPPPDRPAARADGARVGTSRVRARGARDRVRAVDPGPA